MCASKPSGVIACNAGSKRNANSSTAKSEVAAVRKTATNQRENFMLLLWRRSVSVERHDESEWRMTKQLTSTNDEEAVPRIPAHFVRDERMTLASFLGRSRGRFLCVVRTDTDFFQKWLDRLFAAEKLFDGNGYVTRIAWFVDFVA